MDRQQYKMGDSGPPTGAALFRQAKGGCRASLNQLMETHDGLVHAVVRRQVLGELPYADALQAGRIGLWGAIMRFDPGRGYAFSTYAWQSIVHHVWRAVKVHTPARLEGARAWRAAQGEWDVGWYSEWRLVACVDLATMEMAWLVYDTLHELVTSLPQRLGEIVVARYGLDGRGTHFYREIGEQLEVSSERIRQLHHEALVWLRHPPHSESLRSLLGRHRVEDYEWAEGEAQDWLRKRGGRNGRS
jgi:RNA polymerase sigma factor (sigma-70 family)